MEREFEIKSTTFLEDIPSGLSGENGKIMGIAVRADLTTTFVGKKIGLYINDGPKVNKRIKFSNLDIPEVCFEKAQPILEETNNSHLSQILRQRNKDSHKGNFGHVLVIGGNHGMGGAVRITAEAALRTGAGLVSVVTRNENAQTILKIRPEIQNIYQKTKKTARVPPSLIDSLQRLRQ